MADVTDQLKDVPLFSDLNRRQLKRVGRDFRARWFKLGTSVVRVVGHFETEFVITTTRALDRAGRIVV